MTTKNKLFSALQFVVILLASCEAFQKFPFNKSKLDRVKRQDGYVYNRPSIAFDLPARPTSTQAPVVGRTQSQMMYYAYPVPASKSDTVNSAFSTSSTAAPSVASRGYNYQPQGYGGLGSGGAVSGATVGSTGISISTGGGGPASTGYGSGGPSGGGYNYGASSKTASTTAGSISVSTASGTTSGGYSGVQSSTGGYGGIQNTADVQVTPGSSSVAPSGYNYGSPSTTPSTTAAVVSSPVSSTVGSTAVSTNAPKYLPPLGSDGNLVKIGGVASTPGSFSTPGVPSDVYLPPKESTSPSPPSVTPGPSRPSPPSRNAGYLPPESPTFQPPPSLPSSPAVNPSVAIPTSDYLPPISNPAPTQGAVSTPAVTYLPPVF